MLPLLPCHRHVCLQLYSRPRRAWPYCTLPGSAKTATISAATTAAERLPGALGPVDTESQVAATPGETSTSAQAAAATAVVPQPEVASEPSEPPKPKRKRTSKKDAGDPPAAEAEAAADKPKAKGKGRTTAKRASRKKATADDEEEEGGAEGKPRKKIDRSDPKLVTSAEDMPSWARVSFSNVMQQRAQYDQMRRQRDDEVGLLQALRRCSYWQGRIQVSGARLRPQLQSKLQLCSPPKPQLWS